MPREKEDYRVNLEMINEMFPDKLMLTVPDVMKIYGYRSETSVRNHFPFQRGKISKATVARIMCG